jgi:hydroxymethylpyrimidine/phosphomethylpyrimidine kinase
MEGAATDVLFDGEVVTRFTVDRVEGGKIHGTGCTLSAALASGLALGLELTEAVVRAKAFITRAIRESLPMGQGSALVNHFVSVESD